MIHAAFGRSSKTPYVMISLDDYHAFSNTSVTVAKKQLLKRLMIMVFFSLTNFSAP
jgi:hypothetical protein